MNNAPYIGWDTHAYSQSWAEVAVAHQNTLQLTVTPQEWAVTLARIQLPVAAHAEKVGVQALRNSYRVDQGGWTDPQLANTNVARLLVLVLDACENEPSLSRLLGEILADIGTTCVQGQSHRLFALWRGVQNSNVEQ